MKITDLGPSKAVTIFSTVKITREHPTQALLDFYTISKQFLRVENLTITMVGDLLNGRTVHSLLRLVSLYQKMRVILVSPELLRLPGSLLQLLKDRRIGVTQAESLDSCLGETDVLYVTRVQKERFTDLSIYESLKHRYIITPKMVGKMKRTGIVMHPLPRVGEITMDVDADHRAVYFRDQMKNGMYVRMAILSLVLE